MPSSLPVICEEGPRGNILKKYLLYQQRKLVKVSYFVFFFYEADVDCRCSEADGAYFQRYYFTE